MVESPLYVLYENFICLFDYFLQKGISLLYAKLLFDGYPEKDVVCWNSMIDAYVKAGEMELARLVFDEMPCRDVVSWNSVINGYGVVGSLDEAKKLFDQMPGRNVVSWNSMLAGYVKCGCVEDAVKMFRRMPRRDVVLWNAMLACYAQNGKSNEALALFDEMKVAGVRANEATVVSVLSAIGQLGGLDQGLQLHMYTNENDIKINPIVATALIDMYVKCGNVVEPLDVFNSMQTKDILPWNTMVIGMGMHGHANDAQQLFKQIQLEGIVRTQ
ncbi:putative tetratricopeptide-like helical domain superfamily [Helianthus annuus]|nr:putative tetratricopeptide-like helical domain superfamily [Helianthus annuus]KAJ0635396.1 putative tetratricopeptide-like helical domain superfamily [Helianthus annuus]